MSSVFGPFELDRLLGRGGMAEVFVAHRVDDPRAAPMVLKRILPDYAHDAEFLRRFVLEAQVTSRLEHPNLVRFREFGRVGDCHYIAMDYVDGYNLHRLMAPALETNTPPPLPVAIHLALGILDGLAAMHDLRDDEGNPRPMLHRDVTPANVIVTKTGRPVLIDFGITKDVFGPAITVPGKVIGTARYMSPEHRAAEFIDAGADVFSASVILWELMTGRHPWPPLDTVKEILRTTFDPPELPPGLATELMLDLQVVALRGLACERGRRFTSAGEMSRALSECRAARAIGQQGEAMTRQWIASLGMRSDATLREPVVDHAKRREDGEQLAWTPLGRVDSEARARRVRPSRSEAEILDVPPLPPPRHASLGGIDDEARIREALGRPRWVIALVVAGVIAAGVLGCAILFHVHL